MSDCKLPVWVFKLFVSHCNICTHEFSELLKKMLKCNSEIRIHRLFLIYFALYCYHHI